MTSKQRDELQKISASFIMYPVGYGLQNLQCKMSLQEIKDIVDTILAAPLRNCDRPECATTKAAQEVWRKEDGGKTAYYEWLLATSTKGETDGSK